MKIELTATEAQAIIVVMHDVINSNNATQTEKKEALSIASKLISASLKANRRAKVGA